jgi:predicted metal-dependent phosphoesterase TrpH
MTPTRLVDEAVRAGISAIALTDHNTVTGLPEFLSACEQKGIIGVPGVEFSTDYKETELHILEHIRKKGKNTTYLIITHRQKALEYCTSRIIIG